MLAIGRKRVGYSMSFPPVQRAGPGFTSFLGQAAAAKPAIAYEAQGANREDRGSR